MAGSKREAVGPSISFLLNSSRLTFYPSILLPLDLHCRAGINTLYPYIHDYDMVPQQMRKTARKGLFSVMLLMFTMQFKFVFINHFKNQSFLIAQVLQSK